MSQTYALRSVFSALVLLPLPLMAQSQEGAPVDIKPDISDHVMSFTGRFNLYFCIPPENLATQLINKYGETEFVDQKEPHANSGLRAGIVKEPYDANEDGKITASFFVGTHEMMCLIADATVPLEESENGQNVGLKDLNFEMLYYEGDPSRSFFVPSAEGVCFTNKTTERTMQDTEYAIENIIEHSVLETESVSIGLYQKEDSEAAFLLIADHNKELACLTAVFKPPEPNDIPISYLTDPDDAVTFGPDPL